MAKINVAPTRSNLIRIRKELQFSKEGYEILNRKREVLTTELIQMAHKAEELQSEVWKLLAEAYEAMERAQLNMGRERVEWAALAANKTVEVQLKFRGIMGVSIPVIESKGAPAEMLYSLGDTNASLDEASSGFAKVTKLIPELSMVMTTVWRLATELRKTQRRVNALQYIFIPEYEETVSFIVSSLEEREREDTFMLKMLKNRTKKKHEAENAEAII
ncbi:MAG: V-type ATP synthase subunit D [Chloroflexi bacterium HGW-Chloroflexi-4]|jgi:V/A-type H+-transporting ATPase subunit D|nr:MAG: V-type ATP synthase subunit D [Chloroflexi bacterium HGW-Chloroflexi-4]